MVIKWKGVNIGWVREAPGGGVGEARLSTGAALLLRGYSLSSG